MRSSKSTLRISIKTLGLLLFVYAINGCKKPESSYALQQYEYAAGDMLLVENLSINSKETKWEVLSPEKEVLQTSEQKNPSLILGIMNPDGVYTLRLTSSSKKEKKSSVDEKPFMVKTIRTYLTINQSGNGDHDDYLVYIDNQLIGEAGYSGQFQKQIPLGTRIVKLVADNDVLTKTIVFKENDSEYLSF